MHLPYSQSGPYCRPPEAFSMPHYWTPHGPKPVNTPCWGSRRWLAPSQLCGPPAAPTADPYPCDKLKKNHSIAGLNKQWMDIVPPTPRFTFCANVSSVQALFRANTSIGGPNSTELKRDILYIYDYLLLLLARLKMRPVELERFYIFIRNLLTFNIRLCHVTADFDIFT